MSSPQPTPRVYLRLVAQPLDIWFRYVQPLRPNVKSETKGHVQFFIKVADREYGPFMTTYRCTEIQWNSRKSVRPSLAGKRLRTRLGEFSARVVKAWQTFNRQGDPITADMLFKRGGFTTIQLVKGGTVYVL